jgi:phosphoserine phosphatase RsbU/P
MASHSPLYSQPPGVPFAPLADTERRIIDLQRLQRAVQQISSILDLEVLLDQVTNGVAQDFGCTEASVHLKDPEREELVLAAVRGCSLHGKGHRVRIGQQGLIGHVAAHGRLIYAPDVRKDDRYLACEENVLSELDIPLIANGELIGVFSASHPEVDAFSPDRIELFQALADHLAVAVVNANRYQEQRRQNERMVLEQEEARKVQRALLPRHTPLIPGLRVEADSAPARAVGGDWYDYVPMANGRWGFVLADVSGKGLAAALLMTSVRSVVRAFAHTARSADEVLNNVNCFLVNDMPDGRFVTMLFAVFDPATRMLSFANAGHPWPLLVHGETATFLDGSSGPPLGLFEAAYEAKEFYLARGSRLLFYSDGITEAENAQQEEFGAQRMQAILSRPEAGSETILQAVDTFSGGILSDDATALLLRSV